MLTQFSWHDWPARVDATWTEICHDNLTLPKSTEKCWRERDLRSHLRDTGPPLYMFSYRAHRDWRQVFIQLNSMRCSREKFLFMYISEDDSEINATYLAWFTGIRWRNIFGMIDAQMLTQLLCVIDAQMLKKPAWNGWRASVDAACLAWHL